MTRLTIAMDLDKTLTRDVAWDEQGALTAEPNTNRIQKLNTLYGQHTIIIHTARVESLRYATAYWLAKHGVKYHALVMGKVGADIYVDDKAVSDVDFYRIFEGKEDTSLTSESLSWYSRIVSILKNKRKPKK